MNSNLTDGEQLNLRSERTKGEDESALRGFQRFQLAMVESFGANFMPLFDKHHEFLSEAVKNKLFKRGGPTFLDRKPSSQEQHFQSLFRDFNEITNSIDTLKDIALYIRRFPFEDSKLSRDRYLRFMVASHFQELDILRSRIVSYVKRIERRFKADARQPAINELCKALQSSIEGAFDSVKKVRNKHVHETRLGDDDFDRLSTLALLARIHGGDLGELYNDYYREIYRELRKTWKAKIDADNRAIEDILNFLFDQLYPILFDTETRKLICLGPGTPTEG